MRNCFGASTYLPGSRLLHTKYYTIQEYRSALTDSRKLGQVAKGDDLQEMKANANEKIGAIEEVAGRSKRKLEG